MVSTCVLTAALSLAPAAAYAQDFAEHTPGQVHGREIPEGMEGAEELEELARLSHEAGGLGEELHAARAELEAAEQRAEETREAADAAAQRATHGQEQVDSLAVLRYRGGGTDSGRAAILADSPRNLIDRMGVLRVLSGVQTTSLDDSRRALDEAEQLSTEAAEARRYAEERAADLEVRNDEMQERIAVVQERVDALEEEARAVWTGGPAELPADFDLADIAGGVNSAALEAGMTRIGAPYSWGATGPDAFDCSGLMVWAYAQTGKSLPRSSQMQAGGGAEVSRSDMQPGDLIIYYPGNTHVGMYAGNGMVLHASDYGVPVKLDPYDSMPISTVRRY